MRRPIDINQLKNLPFGSKVKLVSKIDETKTHICFVFGDKLAFEDGSFDEISNFGPYSNWEFYSLDELGNLMWEELIHEIDKYYKEVCKYDNSDAKWLYRRKDAVIYIQKLIEDISKRYNYK